MKFFRHTKATMCYIIFIVMINSLFTYMPLVSVMGHKMSPADLVVGLIYVMRDFAQREIGHYVIVAMIIGAALSYLLADPTIALASVCAFIVGETIDWSVFTFTGKPLSERILLSASISSPLDSMVFLALIGRLQWFECTVMTLFKLLGVILLWGIWRRHHKSHETPMLAEGVGHV